MNIDRIAPGLAVVAALLATFIANEWWSRALVVIGLVHGLISPFKDHAWQAMIIVGAFAFPTLANNLDAIPAVGTYLNTFVDHVSVAIAGYALAALIMEVKSRIMPDQQKVF